MPGGRQLNSLPNDYSAIFVFASPRWFIPREARVAAMAWGDVWDITPDHAENPLSGASQSRGQRHPHSMADELADR